jgi:hypothetical protein
MDRRIATFTGGLVDPFALEPQNVNIIDIAHSLSNLCRYNGHSVGFYSVAEHSVLMAREVSEGARLYALLHDATEAYFSDVPKPIKESLPELERIETSIWEVIKARFNLDDSYEEEVKEADLRMLCTEQRQLGFDPFLCCKDVEPYKTRVSFLQPSTVKFMFMQDFFAYGKWYAKTR